MPFRPGPAEYFTTDQFDLSPEAPLTFEEDEEFLRQLASLETEMAGHQQTLTEGAAHVNQALSDSEAPLQTAATSLNDPAVTGALTTPPEVIEAIGGTDQTFLDALASMPPETWQPLEPEQPLPQTNDPVDPTDPDPGSQQI